MLRPRPHRILDAHHHFWNLSSAHYPWLSSAVDPHFFLGDYAPLRRENFLPDDYQEASRAYFVAGTVHIEAERDRDDQVGETRWLTELHRATGLPSAIVGHAWFDRPECEERLLAHLESPLMRGIRSKPVTAGSPREMEPGKPGTMQDEKWLRGFALLERHKLSWDLRVPYWHLGEAAAVARAFPGTAIVLNHTGFPWDRSPEGLAAWRAGMEAIADCPNVWLKVSELGLPNAPWTVEGNRQVVREAIGMFGIERCMFGSNWPVSTLRASYETIVDGLVTILGDLPENDLDRFFYRNAVTFYRIAPGALRNNIN
ncbi:MAG: amidohydrolase 2 [Herminiimonas sp.]|jgi:predicted TIM-barrel fold metal-dependent hydrolase|nr:amidohydrolase 2 [Herminiimonas sp.]